MGNKNKNKNQLTNLNSNNLNQNNNGQPQPTNIFIAPVLMRQITEEEYQNLKKENLDLQTRFLSITNNERLLQETIKNANILTNENDKLREENKILNARIKELENKNNELEQKIDYLVNKDKIIEALSKLNDCDKMANDAFKNEYRKYFGKGKYDNNVPNLGQFIENPPNINITADKDDYDFWEYFCKKYPNSNNNDFRQIYIKISTERVQLGAHYNIHNITENEFNDLMKIALPDLYMNNKKLCDDYRKWLYLF